MKRLKILGLAIVLAMLLAAGAWAAPITLTSWGDQAQVTFEVSGSNLIVTLSNISTADVMVPSDVLAAVFFTLEGNPTLTPVSAVLADGSSVVYDPDGQPAGGVVGGEWAYLGGLSGAPLGAYAGISSSGLGGLFGGPNFPGTNLAPPAALDGLQYGILSAGDNAATGNAGVTGSGGLIKNSVVFTLSGLPAGFDLWGADAITNVSFQYGTSLRESNLQVPEPSTLLLLGFGLVGVGVYRRMRK